MQMVMKTGKAIDGVITLSLTVLKDDLFVRQSRQIRKNGIT